MADNPYLNIGEKKVEEQQNPYLTVTPTPAQSNNPYLSVQAPAVEQTQAVLATPVEERQVEAKPLSPFESALKAATPTIPAKGQTGVMPAVEGTGGAAFGVYRRQPIGGRTTETALTPEKVVATPELFNVAQKYLKERQPNKPLPKDPAAVVEAFRSSMVKGDFDKVSELTWALNATPEQKAVAKEAYQLSGKLGTPIGEELMSTLNPLESPSTYVGAGAGWAVKQAALYSVKTAMKSQLMAAGVGAGVEGAAAGAGNIVTQKTQVAVGLKDEVSYAEAALVTGIGIITGGVGGKQIADIPVASIAERKAGLAARKTKPAETVTDEWLAKFSAREAEVKEAPQALFESTEAKQTARAGTLDKMAEPTDTTKAVLNDAVLGDVFKVAKQLFKDNPELRPDLNEVKITQGIVNALEKADEDVIQQAALRAGVKPAEFLEAFKVTMSDAGQFLQNASAMSKFVTKLSAGDPALEDALKRMATASQGTEYWTGKVLSATNKGFGASVGLSTASLSTAVMNGISLIGTVTVKTAGDMLDAAVNTTGRMLNDLRGNTIPVTKLRVKEDIGQSISDSLFLMNSMVDGGYTAELSDMMLKNNPRLANMVSHVGTEMDARGLPEVVNTLNVANRAVDSIVRRPVFVQSVKDRMKALDLDYEDFLANNKPIPTTILKSAVEDTMKMTFSYEFKKTGERSIEGAAEDLAFYTLDAMKKNDTVGIVSKTLTPFIRFQMNAVRYTYRLTPFSGVAGVQELKQAAAFKAEGKLAEAAGLAYDAKRKVIDSAVGSAAILAGMSFREENADLPFHQSRDKDGTVRDNSTYFPFVNIMALSEVALVMKDAGKDLWYTVKMTPEERAAEATKLRDQANAMDPNAKGRQELINQAETLGLGRVRNFDGAKFTEVVTGMGRSAGVQRSALNDAIELIEGGLSEAGERKAGTLVGDFISRFDNVFNPLYDAVNFLRDDMRIVEPKASTKMADTLGPFGEAAVSTVIAPIPGARDVLQSKPSLFQQEEQKVPAVARQVQGTRPSVPTSKVENELLRLNIQPYTAFKPTGNKDLDVVTIKMAQPIVKSNTEALLSDKSYQALSMNGQKSALEKRIADSISEVKDVAKEYFETKDPKRYVELMYSKIPKTQREASEDQFRALYKKSPTTTEEKRAIIDKFFNLAEEVGKFAKGGLAQQTERAFMKR